MGTTLRILATSDVHGHLLPFDYFTCEADTRAGLTRLATLIRRARAEAGANNCVLLDNGDFLQGTALTDLTARPGSGWHGRHPVIRAMNQMGYDAATIGNHEFNFGLDWLEGALVQARFPLVCANAVRALGDGPRDDTAFLPPFTILHRTLCGDNGAARDIRIGVIGLTPPQAATWDHGHLAGRLALRDMVETARAWLPAIRGAGADIVIALAHSGIGAGPDQPMMENAARALARLPGLDALIAGHSHRRFPEAADARIPGADITRGTLHGLPCVNPGFGASHLGQIDLHLAHDRDGWRVTGHRTALLPATSAPPCPRLSRALARAHAHTLRLTARPLGHSRVPLHSYLALARDDPGLALVNAAQRAALATALAGTAPAGLPVLSASAPFRTGGPGGPGHYTDIPAGPLRLRNLADLYGFPNTLCGLLVTGAGLRDWLERAAICFNRIVPGQADQPLLNRDVPGHVFDVIDGLSYAIDLAEPARYDLNGRLADPGARRIRDLRFMGRPVADKDRFAVATNSYRAWGGGPFEALAETTLIHRSERAIRDILAAHIEAAGTVAPTPRATWRFATMPPGTSALLATGPGLRTYPEEIAALGATETGFDDAGFINLRLPLDGTQALAYPRADAYMTAREVGAGRHLANPVRSGRKQP
ncbi:2',3'-cyclic-nucleotide 2'-phosphodiesterase/3'-nucleotidase [Roseovarius sp. MBR-78]